MMRRLLRKLFLLTGCATLAVAAYAHSVADFSLRATAISIFAVVVAAAYAFGFFQRAPKPPPAKPARPAQRVVPKDNSARRIARANPPPPSIAAETAPEPSEDLRDDELYIVFARLAGYKTGADFTAHVDEIIAKNKLPSLTTEDVARLAAEIDKRDLRGKTFKRTPGVALVRLQRADLDVDYGGTSWLGGLPTLGDTPWPRDDLSRAMHHLAQIDLSTIPEPMLPPGMPNKGALAFFMTTATDAPRFGKVLYLPDIGNIVTDPPRDLVPIYHGPDWGYFVKGYARADAPDTFPRWPIEFVLLPMENQNRDDDAHEFMRELLPYQAAGDLTPLNYRKTLPDFARPFFWDTAHRFTMSVRLALEDVQKTLKKAKTRVREYGPQYQADVDTIRRDLDAFSTFVDEVSVWAVSNGPWEIMSVEDVAQLEAYFAQVRDNGTQPAVFKPFYQFTQGELISVQEAATATLVAAVNAPPDIYKLLPFEVRDDIDTRYRIASQGRWHQMFGLGTKVGSVASKYTHHHLLLQLHSDQLVNWMWGDHGVVQFWISEEDLLAANWDEVRMTIANN